MSTASKAAVAEFAGTLSLLAIVIGSGIMGETLAQGNVAIALLANALATAAGLYVLITALGPISGAHFNPVVTLMQRLRGETLGAHWSIYLLAQFTGAVLGVWLAHAMFDLPILQASAKARATPGLWISEVVATVGLLATIALGAKASLDSIAARVGGYIFAAYWFTASTSFANPAVTFARMFSDTFAGILPAHAPAFIAAQCVGLGLVLGALRVTQSASNGAR
ncbi:MAG: aquaporin [Xanthomonadales bacterium]|nr:aquaporin [Xanthomonadales bacterium]